MKPILTLTFSLIATTASAAPNYQDDVLPIFKQHCLGCHNADKKKAGLDLSSFQAIQVGSSGGAVVKAGLPDTSPLFMAVDHHEDYAEMPPNKPKLPATQLKTIHSWIAGGLIASTGGKPQLRDLTFNVSAGSATRPENPAVPINLPDVSLAKTNVALPITAMASSAWADVIAINGHEQILLFGRNEPPILQKGFTPVGADDVISRHTFDQAAEGQTLKAGKFGQALFLDGQEIVDEGVPSDTLTKNGGFTFSAWVKPNPDMQQPTVYGRESFYIMLERTTNGWRVRGACRAANNSIHYSGRIGEIRAGDWQHVAVTCDGKDWAFFYNGQEIVRQPIPADKAGFLDRPERFNIGGDGKNEERRYRGGIDDLRFYKRALSSDEIIQMLSNASPSYGHIGTLPFPEGAVHDLRFSQNGELLIAAGGRGADSGKVVIYDVKTGQRQATIGNELDIVLTADISADHQYVAIGTPAKMVKIFSTQDGKLLHRIEKHTDWVTVVRFSPDGKLLATADRNGGIHVWETAAAGIVYTLDEHKMNVTAMSWRADGKVLASAAEDGKFVLWDMKDGWASRTALAHSEDSKSRYSRRTGILDIAFARDGRLLTTGRDRTIRLWTTDGTSLSEADSLDCLPLRAAFAANGNLAFLGDFKGNLQVWNLEGMTPIQVLGSE